MSEGYGNVRLGCDDERMSIVIGRADARVARTNLHLARATEPLSGNRTCRRFRHEGGNKRQVVALEATDTLVKRRSHRGGGAATSKADCTSGLAATRERASELQPWAERTCGGCRARRATISSSSISPVGRNPSCR
jgi:hypothetical protein